jgi:hypothetical protein
MPSAACVDDAEECLSADGADHADWLFGSWRHCKLLSGMVTLSDDIIQEQRRVRQDPTHVIRAIGGLRSICEIRVIGGCLHRR